MTEIYVLDTETTGLSGGPGDLVVDIGIVAADTETGEVEEVFSSVVGYSEGILRKHEDAWIFQNTDLGFWQVTRAPSVMRVIGRVREILHGKPATSYNTAFDFGKFLYRQPWSLGGVFRPCPCIMRAAARMCRFPGHYGGYRWPRLEEAYGTICPTDPADICGRQTHRALSDAKMAAHVLLGMHRAGRYPDPEADP